LESILIVMDGSKSDWTSLVLAASGMIFAFTGEIDTAYRYGKLALRMMDKGTNSSQDGRAIVVTYLFVWHWKNPYHDCLEAMLRAYKIALDAGDIEYLFFSILGYSVTYYQCGLQLDPIAKDMRRFRDLLEYYGQTYYLSMFQTQEQFILNLMDKCDDRTILTGEAMNQEECLRLWSKTPNPRAMTHLTLNRMYLAYFFDDLPLAEKMASELCHPLEFGPVPWLAIRFFFEGLICFGLAKSASCRRRYQRRGLRFLRKLEKFVD
jgi:predicted ATPase